MEGVASLSHPAPQSQLNRSVHHGRYGRLRLDRLIARHGADFLAPELRHLLAGDCPKRDASLYERCSVYFPNVPTVF